MAIGTVEFDLSMANHDTGEILTARSYTVEGVTNADGSLRQLSIGQLVMALCFKRAAEMEAQVIGLMEDMNSTSELLADLTDIEQKVVDEFQNNRNGHAYSLDGMTAPSGKTYLEVLRGQGIMNNSQYYVRNDAVYSEADILYDDFISQIESKMDEKNSFSQQKMIELQSITNKRDQSYDMISNILKSINTQIIGNVNNF